MHKLVVIGAGINGVSAAIWARRMGCEVTLVDKAAPGMGASFGNAGVLAASAVVPLTTPGLLWRAPGMLMDREFPLFVRYGYLPRMAGWLARYLSHANDRDCRRIAGALGPVVTDSLDQHMALTEGLSARRFVHGSDYVYAYPDRAAMQADAYGWALKAEAGFVPEVIEGGAVQEYEPALGPGVGCLAVMKGHGRISDPGGYVAALAQDFEAMGGRVLRAEVMDFDLDGGRLRAVLTDRGPLEADRAVLALGAWSKGLMARLGLRVPMETERGYHLLLKGPSVLPRVPVMVASGQFVATPMEMGLRLAGIAELGGLEAGPSEAPIALLKRQVRRAFPTLDWQSEETWMGHRPAPSDSLPLVGEVAGTGVFAAFGHHHVGLTGGAKTGRWVACLLTGQRVNADLSAYDPMRFRK
ncbi:NAD(P)/FAD-dependent oxidoreductase [Tropicibacter alexandrii]|uniref:NAD(P)/FAD-dependent oxidoreductase n=1 Tax=Tropicibacter alexandrii TaxID=2267683 RepID=UPI000EF44D35|nr:FAD-binding oxidoreductase [Tropicibacter alexandrii]